MKYCTAYKAHNCGRQVGVKQEQDTMYFPICCRECAAYRLCSYHKCENEPEKCGKQKQ